MWRRILLAGGLALALFAGTRLVRGELARMAWETRRAALLELATEHVPARTDARRPWELGFETQQTLSQSSSRFSELIDAERPTFAWGAEPPRSLSAGERAWIADMHQELSGLARVVEQLRRLDVEDLEWHGEVVRLGFLRECTHLLCASAWQAAEEGRPSSAAQHLVDALALARATDGGDSMSLLVRASAEGIALRSARALLASGQVSATLLRGALAPLLADWSYAPDAAEARLYRDLTQLAAFEPPGDDHWSAWARRYGYALEWARPVERALDATRLPVRSGPWAGSQYGETPNTWFVATEALHRRHAQRNVALTALAVADWRERHGTWPGTLADLGEELGDEDRLDPWTGRPLAYSLGESGARIGPATWALAVGKPVEEEAAEQALLAWTLAGTGRD